MKFIFIIFAFLGCTALLPCVWAVDDPPPAQGGPSTEFCFTENEAVIRVMQLLSYTGDDPAIPMAEVKRNHGRAGEWRHFA
jgi:hypothetical protein